MFVQLFDPFIETRMQVYGYNQMYSSGKKVVVFWLRKVQKISKGRNRHILVCTMQVFRKYTIVRTIPTNAMCWSNNL